MNEHDLQFRVRQHLNVSARNMSPTVATRLQQARRKALEKQKTPVRGLSLAGIGGFVTEHVASRGWSILGTLFIVLAVVGSGVLGELLHITDLEEVDSALLADDLPIDAYLDRGFDTWVQNNSPE